MLACLKNEINSHLTAIKILFGDNISMDTKIKVYPPARN